MIALLPLLAFGIGTFNIRDYGAIDDGKTLCTHAIQGAVDAAAPTKGVVQIPAGTYLSGSIHLRSGVELHLDTGATLLGSRHRSDYQVGQWYALLLANNLHDIAITGEGTIDGHGKELAQDVLALVEAGVVKIPPNGWRPSAVDRPEIIEFRNCHGVRVENVTIRNSACWVQTYRNCFDLSIKGIHVDSKTYWNNDGIDVVDCQKVHISDCDVDSDDDGICLKSETRGSWCQDVLIENCKVRSSASAIKFGTGSAGGFRRVLVRHIVVRDTYRSAIALESVDGGTLEDVNVENIQATNTGNAFFIRLGHRNLSVPPGRVQRVSLTDIDVEVPVGQPDIGYPFKGPPFIEPHNLVPSSIVGHRDASIQGVILNHIKIRFGGGANPKVAYRPVEHLDGVPERASDYPDFTEFGELPAWGLFLRHVNGLVINDFQVILGTPDYRPAFVADDVSNLMAAGIKVSGADPSPAFVVRGGQNVRINAGIRQRRITTNNAVRLMKAHSTRP